MYQLYVGLLFYPGHIGCLVTATAKLHVIKQTHREGENMTHIPPE